MTYSMLILSDQDPEIIKKKLDVDKNIKRYYSHVMPNLTWYIHKNQIDIFFIFHVNEDYKKKWSEAKCMIEYLDSTVEEGKPSLEYIKLYNSSIKHYLGKMMWANDDSNEYSEYEPEVFR